MSARRFSNLACLKASRSSKVEWSGLFDIAIYMDVEDGVIWVYGADEDGEMAFTGFGVESLIELIKIHKGDPTILAGKSG